MPPKITTLSFHSNLLQLTLLHDAKKEEYRMFEGERFYGTFNGSQNILVFRDDFPGAFP